MQWGVLEHAPVSAEAGFKTWINLCHLYKWSLYPSLEIFIAHYLQHAFLPRDNRQYQA